MHWIFSVLLIAITAVDKLGTSCVLKHSPYTSTCNAVRLRRMKTETTRGRAKSGAGSQIHYIGHAYDRVLIRT